jgi:hypothetical protein
MMPVEIGRDIPETLKTFVVGINGFRIYFSTRYTEEHRVCLRCSSRTGRHMGVSLDCTILSAYQCCGDSLNLHKSNYRDVIVGVQHHFLSNGASKRVNESSADT